MRRWLRWALALAALCVASALLLARTPAPREASPDRLRDHADPREPPAGESSAMASTEAGDASASAPPGTLPGSLRGTDAVGGLLVGSDGHLVPSPDALALFDYYLAATGEEPPGVLRARIVAAIEARVVDPARSEAIALLDTYLAFREALRTLAEGGAPPHDLERRLQWIRELRRGHFGAATAEALFGLEERTLAIDLERRRVATDPALDETERAAALAALEAQLPDGVRAARDRARAPARLHARTRALRAAGASDAEIHAQRAEAFGPAAAERLAALDAEQARWQARLESFRDDVVAVEARGLDGDARDAEIEALLDAHFEAHEHRRVRAIEAL